MRLFLDENDEDDSDSASTTIATTVTSPVKSLALSPSEDDDGSDDSDDEDEPSHPLGFDPSWGRTRFALEPPPRPSLRVDDLFDDDEDDDMLFSSGIPASTAPTQALLAYSLALPPPTRASSQALVPTQSSSPQQQISVATDDTPRRRSYADDLEQLEKDLQSTRLTVPPPAASLPPLALPSSAPPRPDPILAQERQRIQSFQQQSQAALQRIINQRQAKEDAEVAALEKEERRQRELAAQEQERRDQEAQKERERQHAKEQEAERQRQQAKQDEAAQQQKAQAEQQAREQKKQADEAAKVAADYVGRAHKLVAQLKQVRASVEPFEKSKTLGKRRLAMKKIVNGKINTLSENAQKVQQVAADVSAAIAQARVDDEAIKASGTGAPEDSRGKRYLLDLLASKVIVRVQAEGFNGVRGDGFPLAAMLAIVANEHKDVGPILAAHFYTVCPMAIPSLPSLPDGASEDDFMESLGMIKDKEGNFESFERFLSRTQGIISMIADIMASNPPTHNLMSGHEGAIKWLTRFLSCLDLDSEDTLPLITAPVLDAFLHGAGHMMAQYHSDEFAKLLKTIETKVLPRVDDGVIGKPSAARFRTTLAQGLEGFRKTPPTKSLPELYYGSGEASTSRGSGSTLSTAVGMPSNGPSNPFGGQPSNPFGGSSAPAPSPFGTSSQPTAPAPNPFGGGSAPSPSPFGTSSAPAPSPFGASAAPAPSPFGNSTVPSSSPFGMNAGPSAPAPSPFGGAAAPSPSSFGTGASTTASPFGGGAASAPSPSPFGATNTTSFGMSSAASPFGSTQAQASTSFGMSSAPSPSPFGGSGTGAPSASPFGGASAPSPFGTSVAPAPSPFGANQSGPTASPFGAANPSSNSPFGSNAAPSPSPFGAFSAFGGTPASASMVAQQGFGSQTTPFGGSSTSPFGASSAPATQQSSFGNTGSSGFGGGNAQPAFGSSTPFGSTPSSFGGQAPTQSASPFGGGSNQSTAFGQSQSTPFGGGGGGNQNQGSFGGIKGGSSGRPPCKFFAKGRCRNGANCKFSHDQQPSGNTFADPFAPRR